MLADFPSRDFELTSEYIQIFPQNMGKKVQKKVKIKHQIIILDYTEHTKAKLFQIPTIKFAQKYEKLLQLSIFIHPVSYLWESKQ